MIVTREDFNIEDIHCQMVYKIQREQQLLRDIEGGPADQRDMASADISMVSINESGHGRVPQLIECYENFDEQEILGGDMCNKAAINWGKGRPMPVQQVIPTPPQKKQQQ